MPGGCGVINPWMLLWLGAAGGFCYSSFLGCLYSHYTQNRRMLGIRCQVNAPAVHLDQGALLTPALGCCPCSHSPCRTMVKSDYISCNCAFVLSHFSVWMSVQGRYVPWTGCSGYSEERHGVGAISP